MKPSELFGLLQLAIANQFPVLIKSGPGVGKSDIVDQATADAGAELIITHPVVSDPTDFKGLPGMVVNPNTGDPEAHFLPFGDLKRLIVATEPTVMFLDDLGQAPPAVQAAAMQLLLARQVNGHKVADCVTFLAATNRKEDKAGVSGILEPVKSRFNTIVELEPDLDDWCMWALSNDMPTELVAFIRFRPAMLVSWKANPDITNSPCPRTIAKAGEWLAAGLDGQLAYEVYEGCAGAGFAAEFTGFLKVYRSLPNPDVVLLNPGKYDVPTDPATLYALSGALAARADEDNAARFFKAISRLPAEFGVMSVRDAIHRDSGLANLREFIAWVTKHQDVLL